MSYAVIQDDSNRTAKMKGLDLCQKSYKDSANWTCYQMSHDMSNTNMKLTAVADNSARVNFESIFQDSIKHGLSNCRRCNRTPCCNPVYIGQCL